MVQVQVTMKHLVKDQLQELKSEEHREMSSLISMDQGQEPTMLTINLN